MGVGGSGFRIQGSWYRVEGEGVARRRTPPGVLHRVAHHLRSRAKGLRFIGQGSGFRVQGLGFRVQGLGSRVWGVGCGVQGPGFRI